MGKTLEEIQISIIESCLMDIEHATLDLSKQLSGIGVPVEAISIEYWSKYSMGEIEYNMWNGSDRIDEPTGTQRIKLSQMDVVAIAKRRQILKRKF